MKNLGSPFLRKQATGILLFRRDGASPLINFGNVRMHKMASNIERTKTAVARKGYVEVVEDRPAQIENRWTVGLDEELPDLTRLQLLAGDGVAVSQAAISSDATMSITGANPGESYLIGYDADTAPFGIQGLTSCSVKDGVPTTYVEGVDYTVDLKAGILTILPEGSIAEDTDLTITYQAAAVESLKHTNNSELVVKGTAYFDEYDQHSELPRARYSFPAQILLSNPGDNDGKKQSEFEVELLATGTIQRLGRVD